MPPEPNQTALDDYMELELAYDGQTAGDAGETAPIETAPDGRLGPFRKKIADSKISPSRITPFLAAVELDNQRSSPMGLKDLFTVWLENGNHHWLNPMDKTNGLGVLEEILFKFRGDASELGPFVGLLTELGREGISPRSFAEFVILPRVREDNNWREWQKNHLEALRIIAKLICTAKNQPPFNQEHLGSGKTRLARDVVLVRYIGRPLAQYQLKQLQDAAMLGSYREAWRKISLQDTLSLYFMRSNALHFIYSMSGKIDLVQLIAVIEQLPEIERAFTAAFPKKSSTKMEKIKAMNLYDYDIDLALLDRRQRGFHSLDFAVEINAYFNIVKALLEKATGVYLCAYYAGLLKSYKNPLIAETIFHLIRVLDDQGGMHIYRWHTKKLLAKKADDMGSYIDFVETHHGCDPEYPQVRNLFRDEEAAREFQELWELVTNRLQLDGFSPEENKDQVSYRDLINAYIKKNPDTSELIHTFQNGLIAGEDRKWTNEYARQLDALNSKELYGPLLRSVIRGIGTGWARTQKASGFNELIEKYGEVNSQKEISARTAFEMPIKPVGRTPAEHDALARQQIGLVPIEKVWNSLCQTEPVNVQNTLAFINGWTLELDKPLEKAFDKKVELEKTAKETADELAGKKLERDIAKQDKTIKNLQDKKENFTKVMDGFNSLDDEQKFITAMILAGAAGKNDDEYSAYICALLLQRYRQNNSINSRLDFLKDDISVDVLSYQQFTFLLNLLETLFYALREDETIGKVLEGDTVLREILAPFLITKKKEVTLDALDAAAKKMTGYAVLQAERAKWQGILARMDEKSEEYFHNMELYTSKSFIDSHYGDMGGICLSTKPELVLNPGFYVQRLADKTDKQIIGMSVLYLSTKGFTSTQAWAQNYWQAFAFNPLSSLLNHCTGEQQLYLYLQYRLNMEKISWMTKMPVVLCGMGTAIGLISNTGSFDNLIRKYELGKSTGKKVKAKGISVYYSAEEFAKALLIIDPRGYEDAKKPSDIPTFYACRELEHLQW